MEVGNETLIFVVLVQYKVYFSEIIFISDIYRECEWEPRLQRDGDQCVVQQPRRPQILPPHHLLLDVSGRWEAAKLWRIESQINVFG